MYESPKPARREEDPYNTGIVGDIPYYHEFDPNNSDHVTDAARKGEISRIRHGGITDCALSLHDDWKARYSEEDLQYVAYLTKLLK